MIEVRGNKLNHEVIARMINYLNKNHPLPTKTLVIHPIAVEYKAHNGKKARALIFLHDGYSSDIVRVDLYTGKGGKRNPYELIKSIAHEYKHALQAFQDGKEYVAPHIDELEKDAEIFAHLAVAGMLTEMCGGKVFDPRSGTVVPAHEISGGFVNCQEFPTLNSEEPLVSTNS